MDAQILAGILLGLRILAVILLAAVIYKQVKQLRTTSTDYPAVRLTIFLLTIILLVGQFVPILLDSAVAFGDSYSGRSANPAALPVLYSLNNAIKDVLIGALLIFLHYPLRRKR